MAVSPFEIVQDLMDAQAKTRNNDPAEFVKVYMDAFRKAIYTEIRVIQQSKKRGIK